jgi:serine/threonine-protein kinase
MNGVSRGPATDAGSQQRHVAGDDATGRLALRLAAANARLNGVALATAVGLIVLGVWAYLGIQDSLRDLRAAGMQALLHANVQALELWIDDRKGEAEHWAHDPGTARGIEKLAAVHVAGAGHAESPHIPAQRDLQERLAPLLKQDGVAGFRVVVASGAIIAASPAKDAGAQAGAGAQGVRLAEVFRGGSRFLFAESSALAPGGRHYVWAYAPVRNAAGHVIAALGFARDADGQFARLFEVARLGATGEVYAFDDRGTLLSGSRFADAARRLGLPGANLNGIGMPLRDPGGDLAAGHRPEPEIAAQPLTRIVALAVASRGRPDDERAGVVTEPYRNYLGVSAVGAWRWLAGHDFGVAIELSAAEAYAPLKYLNLAFSIILALLVLTLAAVLWSSVYVKRLRQEVGDLRFAGQYRLEREIGEGGMAKVYLARHPRLKRPSALKMLKPHIASDEVIERFEREVQLASHLDHPNTIEIYDYGRTAEGLFYYVMEYLDGETLDRLVAAHAPMPIGRALHVLRQVCAALREAHGRGLVHRDIKPQNIMLCQRGGEFDVVKILDFGLVKDMEGSESRNITQFQKMLGTPLYMSPERIRNPGDVDARSDIYSVGAVGFFLLTGRDLFEATGTHDLTYQILHTPAPRLSEVLAAAPRRLDELIARCLAKERAERPHDILVVMALIDAISVEYRWSQRDAEQWWRLRRRA